MAEIHEGGCLCGTVRYCVTGKPLRAYICHCTFCQRRTGSAFAFLHWYEEEQVELIGDGLTIYEHTVDDTTRWFRLHFCKRCGTTVIGTNERRPSVRMIMAGTFDEPNWIEPQRHVWTRSAQHWMVYPENMERVEKGFSPPNSSGRPDPS